MAGIYGVLSFTPNNDVHSDAAILHSGVDQAFHHPKHELAIAESSAIFGSAMPKLYSEDSWPMVSRDGRYILLVQGEIFLHDDSVLSNENWEARFVLPFIENPAKFLESLDGSFILAFYDEVKRRLWLACDRFGTFAMHYSSTKELFAFATQMSALASLDGNSATDERAMAQYIGLGVTLNGRTIFSNIKRLPAASLLTVDASGAKLEEYYTPKYAAQEIPRSGRKQLIERFADAFTRSVRRSSRRSREEPHSIAAALTGGFDSRLTWSAIAKLNELSSVSAFTLGLPKSRDMQLAEQIAHRLGIRHLPHYFDSKFIQENSKYWQRTVELTEGTLGVEEATTFQALEAQQSEYKVLLDSHGGALYRRQFMRLKGNRFDGSVSSATRMYQLTSSPLMASDLLRPELRVEITNHSISALEEFFERYSKIGSIGDQLDFYYTAQLSVNRYALHGNAQLNYLGLHYPILNNAAYALVQQVPERLRRRNWIHSSVIRLLSPELTTFPVDNQGMWAPYRGFSYLRFPGMGYEAFLNAGSKVWGRKISQGFSLQRPLTDQELVFGANFEQFRSQLLDLRPELTGYCDPLGLERALGKFKDNAKPNLSVLQQVLTLGIFLRSINRLP